MHLTVVSPYLAKSLGRIRRHNDITVIGNGVTKEVFDLRSDRTEPSNGHGEPIVFASVLNSGGRLKNGRRLIEAFVKLRTLLGPQIQLWMFGFGFEPHGPAAKWAHTHCAEANIQFRGNVKHDELLHTLARRVTVLVHPSLEEAHCMAVIEAMAIGIPVIAGKTSGGMPWTLGYGKAGLLADVKSPDEIAQSMKQLAENPPLRRTLAEGARQFALSHYQIHKVVDRYLDVLTAAAQEPVV
jgi:L-malate glycosyltransferase